MARSAPQPPKVLSGHDFPGRVYAGVLAAAALSVFGAIAFFQFEGQYQEQYRDPYMVSAQFNRFAGLRAAIAENAVLGYLSDTNEASTTYQAMFNSARYVLAPRMIRPNLKSDWVLGNFTRPADFAAVGKQRGLRLERDFGNGVVLFRREAAR